MLKRDTYILAAAINLVAGRATKSRAPSRVNYPASCTSLPIAWIEAVGGGE